MTTKNENFTLRPATESELKISERVEEIREEWDDAFTPEIPSMVKRAEMKNTDGSYSCITCGIKREKIADWWIEKLTDTQKDTTKEILDYIDTIELSLASTTKEAGEIKTQLFEELRKAITEKYL